MKVREPVVPRPIETRPINVANTNRVFAVVVLLSKGLPMDQDFPKKPMCFR
jgi:hypothetical protein